MTFTLADIQQDITEVVEVHEADLATTEGGGGKIEIPEGVALAVCTGYVEMGMHTNKNGDSKPTAKLFFELFDVDDSTTNYTRVITKDGVQQTVGSPITHNMSNISRNEKAKYRLDVDALLKATGQEGETSPLKLLGKTVMIPVVHNKDKTDPKKFYVNLEVTQCKAPFACNAVGQSDMSKPLSIPVDPMTLPIKMFVFKAPSPTMWQTIFIDGSYEIEDKDGKKTEKSKNWLQETIKKADNFSGSAVESMLIQQGNSGTPLPKAKKAKEVTKEEVPTEAPVPEVAESAPETKSEPVSTPTCKLTPEESEELLKLQDIHATLTSMNAPTTDIDAQIAVLKAKQ